MKLIRCPPADRRSPRHERTALVVTFDQVGCGGLVTTSDFHFPPPGDEDPVDFDSFPDIEIVDDDTGPHTQIIYFAVPPRAPARKP